MRKLLPFSLADLGLAELAWLLLVLGGLSLLVPPGPRRAVRALVTALVAAALGGLRATLLEGTLAWERYLAPCFVVPLTLAAILLAGYGGRHLGRNVAWLWGVALAAVSLLARPFGLGAVSHAAEWFFLLLVGVALCAATPRGRPVLARILRRGRGWLAYACILLAHGALARPFGIGGVQVLGLLFLGWLFHAIRAQGREMKRYVAGRLIGTPIVLFLLLTLSFFLIRAAPGSPFSRERKTAPEIEAAIKRQYHFDRPLGVQYVKFMANLVIAGELGPSTKQIGRSVNEIIERHMMPSVILGLSALALAILIGVTAGLIAGLKRNSVFDYASMSGAMLGLALPTFVVGPLLVLIFAMKLEWFRVTGWDSFPRDLILPAFTLALPFAARAARLTRAGMLEVVNQDYIRTARAKGLSEPVVVLRHTLKGALLPVVSFLGPALASILTGSLVVETIFGVPGLGREFVQSALSRDYGLTLGLVLLFGFLIVFFNLVVDIAYGFLDPRIRHG
ncbi:MAG: ABC transporter permease [Planctomycetaceae bacterium]